MAAAKKKKTGRSARPDFRWIALIFLVTVLISALMSFVSSNLLEGAGLILSFVILICIVLTGILFDIIGVAVTAADEVPFHAMASRKVPEAEDALRLIRNAGRVSSFCNDVIGDICGVISGSAAAVISARVLLLSKSGSEIFITLLLSAVVSGVTVGGEGLRKIPRHEFQHRRRAHGCEGPLLLPDTSAEIREKKRKKMRFSCC